MVTGHPEVLVAEQAFQGFDDWDLADLLACLDDDGLLALREAEHQQDEGEYRPDAHDLDPGSLIVAQHLDERQGCRDGDNLADWRECHTRDGEHIALTRDARHHGGKAAIGQVQCGVADGIAEVVGDEEVDKLHEV